MVLSSPSNVVYCDFPDEQASLVAVFDRLIALQFEAVRAILDADLDPSSALAALVERQVALVLDELEFHTAWSREFKSLPAEDQYRLRRLQRLYTEEWVHALSAVRPDLSEGEIRVIAYGVIALLQSAADFGSGLSAEVLRSLFTSAAKAAIDAAGR